MPPNSPTGLFITGTDTGVGKTYVAALIARSLRATGRRVGVYKPAASGCELATAGELVSEDAQTLWEAAGRPGELAAVCPQRFHAPLAPNLAAREEGKSVDAQLLRSGIVYWRNRSDVVLVEGAGGLMSPLSDTDLVIDLALDLGYPLVVVAENRIGVINQVLQTLFVARHYQQGLAVAGVVLNRSLGKTGEDPSLPTNCGELARRSAVHLVAELNYRATQLDPPIDWAQLAGGICR